MTPRFKITLSLGVIVVLAVAATLIGMTDMSEHRPRLLETLRQITGREVKVGQMRLSPARGFTLELTDLELTALHPTDPPPLRCKSAFLGISPAFLLGFDLRLSSLTLVNPQMTVVLRKEEPLLQRAQEVARDNSRRMEETLGLGLAEIQVGRVEMRDGSLTLVNRAHPEEPALVIEHLQGELLGIAPSKPSPFSGVGRIKSIPVTFSGQLGPLPPTLELMEMPFLLRMEAKSPRIGKIMAALPGMPLDAVADRVDFSTLMNGSLAHGVQTNSWIQVDRLILKDPRSGEPLPPLDAALRQKGEFKLVKGIPELHVQDMFLYQNGTPKLKAAGFVRLDAQQQMRLDLSTLEAVDPAPLLPFLPALPVTGGEVAGEVRLEGGWLGVLRGKTRLDLTRSEMRWGHAFLKKPGVPLTLTARWTGTPQDLRLDALTVANPAQEQQQVQVEGDLFPVLDLKIKGRWDAAALAGYLPVMQAWPVAGELEAEGSLHREKGGEFSAVGGVSVPEIRFGDVGLEALSGEFRLGQELFTLNRLRARMGGGSVEGSLLAHLGAHPSYMGAFFLSGLSLSALYGEEKGSSPRIDGILSGHGHLLGALRKDYTPGRELAVQASVRVEPGYLAGMDPELLGSAPREGRVPVGSGGKGLYWERAEARLTLLNRVLLIRDLRMEAGGMTMEGHGERNGEGQLAVDLTLHAPWWDERGRAFQFLSEPEGGMFLTRKLP